MRISDWSSDVCSSDLLGLAGGYALLRRCLDGDVTPQAVIAELQASGLRGLGGAGFPTARKWARLRAAEGPRVLAVNAAESEPGTFQERMYFGHRPHRIIPRRQVGALAVDDNSAHL